MRKRGVESYLFSEQDRYWDQYLIRFINGYGTGPGVRVDTWGFAGLSSWFLVTDFAASTRPGTDRPADEHRRHLHRPRAQGTATDRGLRLGFTWSRRENRPGLRRPRTTTRSSVYASSRYQWRGVDFMLEYAFSAAPTRWSYTDARALAVFRTPTGSISERQVLQGEIRPCRSATTAAGT